LQEGNYGKLMEKGEECASKFNRSFLAKLLYATAASENGKYDIAIDELRKATILAGNNKDMMLQVLTQKADVYYRMKDYVKAFKTFDEALKNNNNDLTVLNNYAYYLAERNTRLKEAEEMAKRVIEKEKTNSTFLDTYAWILYKRGKIKEAEKIMEGIIRKEIEPDAEYYEHYGYILKKKKDCKNAVINWNIALKIDSTKKELIKEIQDCQERY
jgi:tetratricopeptide (TPR) repeat protein